MHYRLLSICPEWLRFVMMPACESPVRAWHRFTVIYTLLSDLQDFLALRFVWTPKTAMAGKKLSRQECRATQVALDAIVCHTPLNNLGSSRKGSALAIHAAFQALRAGVVEAQSQGFFLSLYRPTTKQAGGHKELGGDTGGTADPN